MDDLIYLNGVDASTGEYLLPPISETAFAKAIQGVEPDPKEIEELKNWYFKKTQAHLGLKEGDPSDLAQAGWGVIFAANADPAYRQALRELLDWRQEQASKVHAQYYCEFSGDDGYQPGESKLSWLARHGMGPGPADPAKVPYYLLIVGDPQTIPYRFQTQLDVQYAAGRIHFDRIEDYAAYAHSVVEAEQRQLARPRSLAFFGVSNPDDPATNLSAAELIQPLAEIVAGSHPDWRVSTTLLGQATKNNLAKLIGGEETPALLFTASHGLGFPNGHPFQYARQGALLTQDWPGPKRFTNPIPTDFYFSADDLSDSAQVFGLLAFFFACFGAGTPDYDEFAQKTFKDTRAMLAPQPFIAALPKRLLTHPRGSALAVVGHVDRAWGYSFYWGNARRQLAVFENTLSLLLKGVPVGAALDPFNVRYAELSSELSQILEDIQFGKKVEPRELAGMWTANNDARNYVVIGDPAVRLMAAAPGAPRVMPEEVSQVGPVDLSLQPTPAHDLSATQPMAVPVSPAPQTLGRFFCVSPEISLPIPPRETIVIGRHDALNGSSPDLDLSNLSPASATISRRHARLTVQDQKLYIEDLNSRNATRLNGQELAPGQSYRIKNGDELRLGDVLLVYIAY